MTRSKPNISKDASCLSLPEALRSSSCITKIDQVCNQLFLCEKVPDDSKHRYVAIWTHLQKQGFKLPRYYCNLTKQKKFRPTLTCSRRSCRIATRSSSSPPIVQQAKQPVLVGLRKPPPKALQTLSKSCQRGTKKLGFVTKNVLKSPTPKRVKCTQSDGNVGKIIESKHGAAPLPFNIDDSQHDFEQEEQQQVDQQSISHQRFPCSRGFQTITCTQKYKSQQYENLIINLQNQLSEINDVILRQCKMIEELRNQLSQQE